MPTSEDAENMGPTITLPAIMDLAAADTLLVTLRQSLAADPSCRLDASNVEKLMLPGIQVVLAAVRSSEKVQVVNPSAAFCAAFEDAALSWVHDKAAEPTRDHAEITDPQPDLNEVTALLQPDPEEAPAQSQPAVQECEAQTDAPRTAKQIPHHRRFQDHARHAQVHIGRCRI